MRHHHLATLGSRLHDKSKDTIACAPHGKTSDQLVSQGLGLMKGKGLKVTCDTFFWCVLQVNLGNSAKTPGLHLLGIKFNSALGEVEPGECKLVIVLESRILLYATTHHPYRHACHLFWTTLVSSLILLPFSPSTFWVLVAMMMISVLVGVTRT